MHQANYGKLEKGVISLSVEWLQQIAEAFGLQAGDLLSESTRMVERMREMQKRIDDLEEQVLDKRRIIDAIKSHFKLEVKLQGRNRLSWYLVSQAKKEPAHPSSMSY